MNHVGKFYSKDYIENGSPVSLDDGKCCIKLWDGTNKFLGIKVYNQNYLSIVSDILLNGETFVSCKDDISENQTAYLDKKGNFTLCSIDDNTKLPNLKIGSFVRKVSKDLVILKLGI